MIIFFSVLGGITLWQFLPEFAFPMLGSLAFLCWVAPRFLPQFCRLNFEC